MLLTFLVIQGLVRWAGVTQPISVFYANKDYSGEVEARISVGTKSNSVIIFLINHGTTKATFSISISAAETSIVIPRGTTATEIISGASVVFTDTNNFNAEMMTSTYAVVVAQL
jgi:hypothetical protein